MDNPANSFYLRQKLASVPVDTPVDKYLFLVEKVWINPRLIHNPNLSTKLSTELSTDSTPLIHRFIHNLYTRIAMQRAHIRVYR